MIRELGADEVVENGAKLLAAGGADVLLATSHSWKATEEAAQGMRSDGRIVVMGASNEPLGFNLGMMLSHIRIMRSSQNGPEYLYEALDYVAKGKMKVVAETYKRDQARRNR
jgi:alcohol dehydrogenase